MRGLHRIFLTTFWLAIPSASPIALQASPSLAVRPVQRQMEGFDYLVLQLRDGAENLEYTPPKGWAFQSSPGFVKLIPDSVAQAEAAIRVAPLASGEISVDEKFFQHAVELSLPKGATKIEVSGAQTKVMMIDGFPATEVTVSYAFYGQAIRASTLYVVRGKDLFEFRLSARAGDFPFLREPFHYSLNSFAGLHH